MKGMRKKTMRIGGGLCFVMPAKAGIQGAIPCGSAIGFPLGAGMTIKK